MQRLTKEELLRRQGTTARVAALESENTKLRVQLAEVERGICTELTAEIELLKLQKGRMALEWRAATDSIRAELEARALQCHHAASAELARRDSLLRSSEQKVAELLAKIDRLEAKGSLAGEGSAANAALQKQLNTKDHELETAQTNNKTLEERLRQNDQRFHELDTLHVEAQSELTRLRAALPNAAADARLSAKDAQIEELRYTLKTSRSSITQLTLESHTISADAQVS
jgi:predicted  nucleic acid-binding Zn-ribbon protein